MPRWFEKTVRYGLIVFVILFVGTRETGDWPHLAWSLLIAGAATTCLLILKVPLPRRAPKPDGADTSAGEGKG